MSPERFVKGESERTISFLSVPTIVAETSIFGPIDGDSLHAFALSPAIVRQKPQLIRIFS